jgi:hypothetical protein
MSSTATIGYKDRTGKITAIYTYRDGYPAYTGKILNEQYFTTERIKMLFTFGDLFSLGSHMENNTYSHLHKCEPWGMVKPKELADLNHLHEIAEDGYLYLFDENNPVGWQVFHPLITRTGFQHVTTLL